MGVTFNRTPEGLLDFRRFGGTLFHRTAFAGATTGPAAPLRARRAGAPLRGRGPGRGSTRPGSSSALVLDDDGSCRGIVALDLRLDGDRGASRRDAVMLATGGPGIVFGRSTNSRDQHRHRGRGARTSRARVYANGEFIQVHPTAIPGDGQAAADVGVGARRGRPRLGAAKPGDTGRRARSRSPSAGTSSRRSTRRTATSSRATSRRARSSRSCFELGMGVGRRARRSTSTSRTSRRETLDAQARRRPRDLREVRGRRPARRCR